MRLLYKAILSHLIVGLPPAVVLGLLVQDVNRDALLVETQQLHLATATAMRDALGRRVETVVAVLDHAERVLDASELSIDRRKLLLRALVADARIPYLAIHGPDGRFDTLLSADDATPPADLDAAAVEAAARRGWAVVDAARPDPEAPPRLDVVVTWTRDGERLGLLGTRIEYEDLDARLIDLRARFLGASGDVEVIGRDGRILASTEPARVGGEIARDSAFGALAHETSGAGLELGTTMLVGPTGDRRLAAVISEPRLGWTVVVSRPERLALASIEAVRRRTVVLSLLAGLAAGIVGLLLARQVSEPIRRLVWAVDATTAGGFRHRVELSSRGEVGLLVGAFNRMLHELDEHRRGLRVDAKLRMRLARFLPPTAIHEVLHGGEREDPTARVSTGPATVLYADLTASAELSDRIPTDQLVAALGDFFAAAAMSVERHGGKVDALSSDAVIGVFPRADHPDAAAAALAAAEALRRMPQAMAETFGLAVAVVTGPTVLRVEGAGMDQSFHVSGEAVERAARLLAETRPREITLDAATRDALGELPPLRAGGSRAGLEVWTLEPGSEDRRT